MAAAQAEEQVVQLNSNAGRSVVALVAQGEENIRLAAVSAPTQQRNGGKSGFSADPCVPVGACYFTDASFSAMKSIHHSLLINLWISFFFLEVEAEKLPDQKDPQRRMRECSVSLFHAHRPPVVIAVKELHVRLPDQFILGQAAERTEVSRYPVGIGSICALQHRRQSGESKCSCSTVPPD